MKNNRWKSTGNAVYLTWYHFEGDVAESAKLILQELCVKHGYEVEAMEVMPDHIHLFVSLPPTEAPAIAIKKIKGGAARTIFTKFPSLRKKLWGGHLWNPSYFVGTAGDVSAEIIKKYIENQTTGK